MTKQELLNRRLKYPNRCATGRSVNPIRYWAGRKDRSFSSEGKFYFIGMLGEVLRDKRKGISHRYLDPRVCTQGCGF